MSTKKYNRKQVDLDFAKYCKKLNTEGNNNEALINIRDVICRSYDGDDSCKQDDGSVLSVKYIAERYEKYISWWKKTYGNVDVQYLPKENRMMSLETFVDNKAYTTEYKIVKDHRFYELFGNNITEDELIKSYEKFQEEKNIRKKYKF